MRVIQNYNNDDDGDIDDKLPSLPAGNYEYARKLQEQQDDADLRERQEQEDARENSKRMIVDEQWQTTHSAGAAYSSAVPIVFSHDSKFYFAAIERIVKIVSVATCQVERQRSVWCIDNEPHHIFAIVVLGCANIDSGRCSDVGGRQRRQCGAVGDDVARWRRAVLGLRRRRVATRSECGRAD